MFRYDLPGLAFWLCTTMFSNGFGSRDSIVLGVGRNGSVTDDPHPVSSVGRVDGASWYNETLDFVVQAFQLRTHLSECHFNDASNILAKHPTGLGFSNNPKHLRPEEAVILRSLSLSCGREGLTGEAACEEVDSNALMTSCTCAPCVLPFLLTLVQPFAVSTALTAPPDMSFTLGVGSKPFCTSFTLLKMNPVAISCAKLPLSPNFWLSFAKLPV